MSGRPGWHKEYWKHLDKETAKKLRTQCPRCGSTQTYYNPQYRTWRCARCEHSFFVEGLDDRPWWKKLLHINR